VLLRTLILSGAIALLAPAPQPSVTRTWHVLGRSVDGRPIRALQLEGSAAGRPVLVVGCIHGTECAGLAVTDILARSADPTVHLWIVPNLNPDGYARGTRQNARGVDLNRNYPAEWRAGSRGPEYPGARPLSERETRIAHALVRRLQPALTLWYHQPQALVRAWGPSIPAGRRFARAAGLPFAALPWPRGTAANWQNHAFPGCPAFVVELPSGPLAPTAARRHAAAVRASSRAARC
jgi:protein MpaA